MASAIGNRAFSALVQHSPAAGIAPGLVLPSPLAIPVAGSAKRGLARAPNTGGSTEPPASNDQGAGSTTATQPQGQQAPPAKPWVAPFDWGFASRGGTAVELLFRIRDDSGELARSGFPELAIHADEARTWIGYLGSDPTKSLSDADVQKLTAFGHEFEVTYRAALEHIKDAILAQLETWGIRPVTDQDLFDLRELVHEKFVHSPNDDVLGSAVELLDKAKDLVGQVDKWVGYGEKAKGVIAQAKQLEHLKEGVKEISDKLGEVKEYVELARNVGKLVGVVGTTPAGTDDIGAFEGALHVSNFVMSKLGVPGIKQLWDGYIFKAAKAAAHMLRGLKSVIYGENRAGAVPLFFMEHRHDAVAPNIQTSLVRGADKGEHFPGDQPMLDFMWKLVKSPDAITVVPAGIEKFFLDWRKQMGEGEGTDQIQTDSSVWNLWNAFSREESPNLVPWLKRHVDDAWVKLYGGMQKPD